MDAAGIYYNNLVAEREARRREIVKVLERGRDFPDGPDYEIPFVTEEKDALEKVDEFVEEKMKNRDPSHGIEHVREVRDLAEDICDWHIKRNYLLVPGMTQDDGKELILISALCHDLCDHKYNDVKREEVEEFLRKLLGEERAKDALEIADNISYSSEVKNGYPKLGGLQRGRDIVSDADKITALGKPGLERMYQYMETTPEGKDASPEEKDRLGVKHVKEKLIRLYRYFIRTQRGKELAFPRHMEIMKYLREKSKTVLPRVVRIKRTKGKVVQDCDVYIGRECNQGGWELKRSKWANPYVVGQHGNRADVIRQYREHVLTSKELLASLPELQGKTLGCWVIPFKIYVYSLNFKSVNQNRVTEMCWSTLWMRSRRNVSPLLKT